MAKRRAAPIRFTHVYDAVRTKDDEDAELDLDAYIRACQPVNKGLRAIGFEKGYWSEQGTVFNGSGRAWRKLDVGEMRTRLKKDPDCEWLDAVVAAVPRPVRRSSPPPLAPSLPLLTLPQSRTWI